ncbi:MAG: hypothetical protein DWG76_06650 [Chloroflexi bacterium]|nr:hypothetical protein [Chloroflexota bacterium]
MTDGNPIKAFVWIGMFTLLWPLTHFVVALMRFGADFQVQASEFLPLLPMGALSGGLLLYLISIAENKQQRTLAVLGYVVASPVGFIGSLGGAQLLPPVVLGATLLGGFRWGWGRLPAFNWEKFSTGPKTRRFYSCNLIRMVDQSSSTARSVTASMPRVLA